MQGGFRQSPRSALSCDALRVQTVEASHGRLHEVGIQVWQAADLGSWKAGTAGQLDWMPNLQTLRWGPWHASLPEKGLKGSKTDLLKFIPCLWRKMLQKTIRYLLRLNIGGPFVIQFWKHGVPESRLCLRDLVLNTTMLLVLCPSALYWFVSADYPDHNLVKLLWSL